MTSRTMIVLGGNAFTQPGEPLTMAGQFEFAESVFMQLEPLLSEPAQVVVTHGNGPQVGHILTRVEEALGKAYSIPLEVCVAESEGELGYVLEQSMYNVLRSQGHVRPIASLLTQVVVDQNDPAFKNPIKPIGPFYTLIQADALRQQGFSLREDSGRGFRRVVASPVPQRIIEVDVIEQLLEASVVVITAGGGGIPVVMKDGKLTGIEAVVDKDLTSALLGEALNAQLMVILTGVPSAFLNFGTTQQKPIGRISISEAKQFLMDGHFAPGSMQPKIEAAIRFCQRPGTRTIICDPASLPMAISAKEGTIIEADSTEYHS
jgi:carbamate kinase